MSATAGGDQSQPSISRGCLLFIGLIVAGVVAWQLLTHRFNWLGWRLFSRDRVAMHDLVDHHLLDHLAHDELLDRLGPPDYVYGDQSTWELGPTFMGVGFLHASCDSSGRVVSVRFEDD